MARSIKGITIEIGGDTSKLQKSINAVQAPINKINRELKDVNQALKLDPKNTELLAQKQDILKRNISATNDKLQALKKAQQEMGDYSKLTDEQKQSYNRLSSEIAKSESAIKSMNNELNNSGKSKGLFGGIKSGLDDVGQKALKVGDIIKANLISDAIKGGMKMLANGVKSVGKAMSGAISDGAAYADDILTLSQQTGIATDELQKYKAIAELTDVPLETMTKSMAKMTKSLESNEEKYKKLGVSIRNSDGSLRNNQEIFNETIGALGKMENATERDALSMQLFGKSAQELNPLIKMGADGLNELTAKAEQMGAVLSQKGLEALGKLDDEMQILKSTSKSTGNILASAFAPAITEILGQTNAIGGAFNDLLANIISGDSEGIAAAKENFSNVIKGFADTLSEKSTEIMEIGFEILQIIGDAILDSLPTLINIGISMIMHLINAIISNLPKIANSLLQGALQIVIAIAKQLPTLIPTIIKAILGLIPVLIENIPLFIEAGMQLIFGLAMGLIEAIPTIIEMIPQILDSIITYYTENLPQMIKMGIQLTIALAKGIIQAIPKIIVAVVNIIPRMVSSLKSGLGKLASVGSDLVKGIWNGISNATDWILSKIKGFGKAVLNGIKSIFKIKSPSRLMRDEIGKNLALGIGVGFEDEMRKVQKDMQASAKQLTYGINNSMNPLVNPNALNINNQAITEQLQGMNTKGGEGFTAIINNNSKYTTPSDNVRLLRQQYELYNLKYGRSRG